MCKIPHFVNFSLQGLHQFLDLLATQVDLPEVSRVKVEEEVEATHGVVIEALIEVTEVLLEDIIETLVIEIEAEAQRVAILVTKALVRNGLRVREKESWII